MRNYLDKVYLSKLGLFLFNTVLFWAVVLAFGFGGTSARILFWQYMIIYIVLNLSLYAFRNYDLQKFRTFHQAALSVFSGTFVGIIASLPFLLLFFYARVPKEQMILISSILFVGFLFSQYLFSRIFMKVRRGPGRMLVVGDRARWDGFVRELTGMLGRSMENVSFVDPSEIGPESRFEGAPCAIVIADHVTPDDPLLNGWSEDASAAGCTVEFAPQLAEEYLGRIPMDVAKSYKNYYELVFRMIHPDPSQRVFDLVVSTFGLAATAVLSLFIIPAIIIDSGLPVFFRQKRIGLNGEPFTIHKFRTMKNHGSHEASFVDSDAGKITRVGNILRRFRLDELPQFYDVLRGEMSIAGPRPEQPHFAAEFNRQIPFYTYRHNLRPGITGWAQINFRYASNLEETARKLEFDLFYIKNRTILLDIQVILKTIETMMGMRGAK